MPEKSAEEIRKDEEAHRIAQEKREREEHDEHHDHKDGPCEPVGGAIKHAVDATVAFVGEAYNTSTHFVVEKAMPAVVDGYKAAEHAVQEGAKKTAEAAGKAAEAVGDAAKHVPGMPHKSEEEKKKDEEAHREAEEKREREEEERKKEEHK